MAEETSLQSVETPSGEIALSAREVLAQVNLIQDIMKQVMVKDVHYGPIPGTDQKKQVLLKAGAEKLLMTFRLEPEFFVEMVELANGHRDYRTRTEIRSIKNGVLLGAGVGSCSTMESKYRWRNAARLCPECGKDAIIKGKEAYGGGWLCFAKKGGCGAKFKDGDQTIEAQVVGKMENEDIADVYNTCLKISKKRSLVDATITVTAASDIFTQDINPIDEKETPDPTPTTPAAKPNGKPNGKPDVQSPQPMGDEVSQIKDMLEAMGATQKQREAFDRMMGEQGLKATLAAVTAKYKEYKTAANG